MALLDAHEAAQDERLVDRTTQCHLAHELAESLVDLAVQRHARVRVDLGPLQVDLHDPEVSTSATPQRFSNQVLLVLGVAATAAVAVAASLAITGSSPLSLFEQVAVDKLANGVHDTRAAQNDDQVSLWG